MCVGVKIMDQQNMHLEYPTENHSSKINIDKNSRECMSILSFFQTVKANQNHSKTYLILFPIFLRVSNIE